jgi:hypothetical protein
MHQGRSGRGMTRRRLIGSAGGWFSVIALSPMSRAFGAADFWNKKEPADWTTEEILMLTTKSPWAKDTRLDLKGKGKGAVGENPGAEPVRDPTTGGFRGGDGTGSGRTAGKAPNVIVTWESARPLFDALRYQIPADFANHYVIGVKDLPILVDAGPQRETPAQLVDWLKNSATLQAKSKEPVEAGVVATTRRGAMVLFGFSRELLALTVRDKEVIFTLDTNQLALRAKFEPKEMIYGGQLAL